MKVWDRAGIELVIPGSAVRLTSVARHVTNCATQPGSPLQFYDYENLENIGIKSGSGDISESF